MAEVIIILSSDADTKAIGSITYIMGIVFDMILLGKQQTKTSADIIHFVVGILILAYIVFILLPVIMEAIARKMNLTPRMNIADKLFVENKNAKTL